MAVPDENITRHLGQTEYVVEFAISQQPSIGSHFTLDRARRPWRTQGVNRDRMLFGWISIRYPVNAG
jgi:hypothetical protein